MGCQAVHLDISSSSYVCFFSGNGSLLFELSSSSNLSCYLTPVSNQLPRFRLALWWLFGYIVLGFVVIEVVYFGIVCRPFRQYWAMPVSAKNSQCATYHNYSIVQMVFNISSDFGLIIIPSVMVGTTRLPLGRKFVLIGIFSMAALTIMAAIMNK